MAKKTQTGIELQKAQGIYNPVRKSLFTLDEGQRKKRMLPFTFDSKEEHVEGLPQKKGVMRALGR